MRLPLQEPPSLAARMPRRLGAFRPQPPALLRIPAGDENYVYIDGSGLRDVVSWTICLFLRTGDTGYIVSKGKPYTDTPGYNVQFNIQVGSGGGLVLYFEEENGIDHLWSSGLGPVNDGRWHFVCGGYDYGGGRFFAVLDDKYREEVVGSYKPEQNDEPVVIGGGLSLGSATLAFHLWGDYVNVLVYDRALSLGEMRRIRLNPLNPPGSGLRLWIPPLPGYPKAVDASGNGNDGELRGSAEITYARLWEIYEVLAL